MMRIQPSILSLFQRQSFMDSQAHLRLTHRWTRQRRLDSPGNCCCNRHRHATTNIPDAFRIQNTPAISSGVFRQQKRYFALGRKLQDDSSHLLPAAAIDTGKERDRMSTITRTRTEAESINLRSEVRASASPRHNLYGATATKAMKRIRTTTIRPTPLSGREAYIQRTSSKKHPLEQPTWYAPLEKLQNSSTGSLNDMPSLEEKGSTLKSKVEEFYSTWMRSRDKGESVEEQIQVAFWLTVFGTQCRQIRKDKVNHDLLLQQIGKYLQDMLEFISGLIEKQKHQEEAITKWKYFLGCLRVQSLSFQNMQEESRSSFESLLKQRDWLEDLEEIEKASLSPTMQRRSYPHLEGMANALGSILQLTLNRCEGVRGHAKNALVQETMDWLLKHPHLFLFNSLHFPQHLFRFNVMTNLLEDPLHYITSRAEGLNKEDITLLASSICRSLLRELAILPAYNIYRWTIGTKVTLQESVVRQMMRLASLEKESLMASRIISTLLKKARKGLRVLELATCRTMAYACARGQDEEKMEDILSIINEQYKDQAEVKRESFAYEARILCHSRKTNVQRTVQLVEERYDMYIAPNQKPQQGLLYPDYNVHARLVQTYLRANERDKAETMLHRMVQFDHRPDVSLLAYVMEYYVKIDDLASTLALFRQMKNSELNVDIRTCTSLVALFAKRKDSTSAFKVVEMMKKDGLTPDRTTYNALLNAYVESGVWNTAMELFTWMKGNRDRRFQPSSHTYNIMLKAHILRAIPVQDVFSFFKQIIEAGVDPDPHTLSLVLQSVVDAGLMNLAEQVFSSIEDRLGDVQGKLKGKGASIWHFTIMIQGYLRAGKIEIARDYATELRERGYTATGVLWSVLVKAYATRDEGEALETSHELVQSALFTNPHEYVGAYQPLIDMHSKRASVEQIEVLLQDLADKEADIPIHLWTALMDAFRRRGNLVGTLEVWNLIFEKALAIVNYSYPIDGKESQDLVKTAEKNNRSNLLCLPLSILIDTLANQGYHERIAQEWLRCRKAGFAFDSHNWNHLCTAFARAGRIVDSLNIITRVLSNEQPTAMWREVEIASLNQSTSNNEAVFPADDAIKTDTLSRPPNRRHQHRVRDDVDASYPLLKDDEERRLKREKITVSTLSEHPHIEDDNDDEDFKKTIHFSSKSQSTPSNLLQYLEKQTKRDKLLSPYYPHFQTMTALDEGMEKLKESGGFVTISDKTIGIQELMEKYPKVQAMLAKHKNKVDLLQEFARNAAVLDQGRN